MDYKKKYEEANDKVAARFGTNVAKEIFTDLYESEDDRIREMLIRIYKKADMGSEIFGEGITYKQVIAWLEKQGEQKFKVGDWINGYYTNYKVLSINNKGYVVEDADGNKINILFENEKFHHLWTIQDAKDGDVLKEDSCIFIVEKMNPNGTAIVHCCLFDDGEFDLIGSTLKFEVDSTKPATKEQRDLLFQKMKEAGYEWNENEKVLVMIGIDNDEEDEQYEELIEDNETSVKQNSAWSESDENRFNNLCGIINENKSWGQASKEGFINWLKSLKSQPHWKPTEEQLMALRDAIDNNEMESLYNDLKKL